MNYYDILEQKAQEGLESLIKYLETDKNLLWTRTDTDDVTTIDIETWDAENYNSEFLTSYEFNINQGE